MVTKKKNDEIEVIVTEAKKRTGRKGAAKKTVNSAVNQSAPVEYEFIDTCENNATKTNDASQINPGRFTAEMLIAMGKQLEEEEALTADITEPIEDDADECEDSCVDFDEIQSTVETAQIDDNFDVEKFEDVVGTEFEYRGIGFIALEESNGGILAISSDILERKMRFAENAEKGSNDWKKSSLRKKLNGEYIKNFNKDDLLPIVSDLTADTGEDNYGRCEDYIAIPTDNMFRKFHKIIPAYQGWVWSLTPWAIDYGTISAVGARTNAKTIYSEQVNHELGVVIVCKFKKDVVY